MKNEIFKYLKENFSQAPKDIDRLIVSAFIYKNGLQIRKNELLKQYQIDENTNEYKNLEDFINILETFESEFRFETLIEFFEFVISPADRVINGAIYTPQHVREFITKKSLKSTKIKKSNIILCDPACGCGGFLFSAAQQIKSLTKKTYAKIFKENLYGLDVQNYSITRAKLLLSLLAITEGEDNKVFHFNLFLGNALNFKWESQFEKFPGFDIIIGNPPYVCSKNIEAETKALLPNWEVCSYGRPDLYIPFFQIGLENLKNKGILSYITMNTFFKSRNGRALREYFQKCQYDFHIIDFGDQQIFKSKSTYTCICIIRKIKTNSIKYTKPKDNYPLAQTNFSFNTISYNTLDAKKGWNLQYADILKKIESTGKSFGECFETRNGIATLKNDIYIFTPIKEDEKYYYLQNGSVYPIEKGICKEIINSNKLTRIKKISTLKQKAIFPYFFEKETVNLFPEDEFRIKYPQAYLYLQSKKTTLAKRDKGNGNYKKWYAYGRNQSLEKLKYKLFFPHISASIPNYIVNTEEELLFYNGLAVIGDNIKQLRFLRKLMSSRLFWFYIVNTSKPYGSGFFSLSRNYIKHFGIYDFSKEDIDYIIKERNSDNLNLFIESKYEVTL